ncbi:MAG: diacylglycerol/polyprenol kinase family protein [Desulfobacterales bacterium]
MKRAGMPGSRVEVAKDRLNKPEINRKLLHLVALCIPFGIVLLPHHLAVTVFAFMACAMAAGEMLRRKSAILQGLFIAVFGSFLRPEEKHETTGGTYFFISGAICAAVFDAPIAYTAMAFSILGDAAAAIAGMKFGRIRIAGRKTLEGAIASVSACLLFWTVFPQTGFLTALAAAVLTSLLELLPLKINDNLAVPLICGFILQTWAGW